MSTLLASALDSPTYCSSLFFHERLSTGELKPVGRWIIKMQSEDQSVELDQTRRHVLPETS